nr:immunoglobulin light chain junction region [Macaca mulatta]MOX78649.1 immunoglobulin light chain junction region [Macaca mulatta]MOX78907.1 immunoglobulin light chain junction region [Macaca mulatta]MOX79235.1 immunoglobulin light chain junction region [Macaca mulatta]MOX79322.1 immunoglobulin light chain junction region [Macaca mulatta]
DYFCSAWDSSLKVLF